MLAATSPSRWMAGPLLFALALGAGSLVACDDDEGTGPGGPPGAVTVSLVTSADTVTVSWTAAAAATSYRVELRTNPDTLMQTATAEATEAIFTADDDGLEDDVEYTAIVFAINAEGETASGNTPSVTTNFFVWDENYPTSLHFSRIGKSTFYSLSPNNGFEQFTGVGFDQLGCKDCHAADQAGPPFNLCDGCHDTADPELGATVDDQGEGNVCLGCHSRQNVEANVLAISDVHRSLGFGCMDCHSLGDVHGDGTAYSSMLEDGAIDAKCENCHSAGNVPGEPPSNTEHSQHLANIDCSTCHMQTVVTCHNCHFQDELDGLGKTFKGPPNSGWIFMLNRNGKVYPANFQSVEIDDNTFVGMAPFYGHTITDLGRTCGDCHDNLGNNPNIDDYNADGVIDVAVWNGVDGFNYASGVIPVPPEGFDALRFDFATLDAGRNWVLLETNGPDAGHILFGTPLTADQMQALGATAPPAPPK